MKGPEKRIDEKLCTAAEAVALIKDGTTLANGGFVGAGVAEALLEALEERFLSEGAPKDLTLVYAAGQGDGGHRGANHLAHPGLVKRVIGGHWGLAPKMGALALEGKVEGYNLPQGVICQLFRDIAAGRPGCITHIGLDTFIDPDRDGGRINERTPPGLVEKITLGGKDWLWYKAFPLDLGFIRGTAVDPNGNLIMDEEALFGEVLPIAQGVHNNGGLVIAQVKKVLTQPLPPQQVKVPGILIDKVVVAEEEHHEQTFAERFNSGYATALPKGTSPREHLSVMPMGPRRLIAARVCEEIPEGAIANLGIGIPEGVAQIAAERDWLNKFTLTVESGPIGGVPAGGLSFGASLYPEAVVDQPSQFDFYDGGGLDFAALGAAQIDERGNVNVSRYGKKLSGVGGFVNITQTAKKVVFCGTLTASGLTLEVKDGKVKVLREGKIKKFVKEVEQISFSADHALSLGQEVLYVTERAVFRLMSGGLELVEAAPGIDVERDILEMMEFTPVVKKVRPVSADVYR